MEADIWAAPVNTFPQIEQDPQIKHNGTIVSFEHPKVGEFRTIGPPIRFSRTPCEIRRPPVLGEHGRAILQEMGFGDVEIDLLQKEGVVGALEDQA
jgi:crotonobetainyl-CoA:carnitine CoA-transferase CaiB-like acyl-CoA transferase